MALTHFLTAPRLLEVGDLQTRLDDWGRTHPALADADGLEHLVHRAQGSIDADYWTSDEVYTALIRTHLTGDPVATSVIIAAMWPALTDSLRRYPSAEDDLAQALITALIEALPRVVTRPFIASNLRWAVRAELRRCTTRRSSIDRRTEPTAQPIADDQASGRQLIAQNAPDDQHGIWQLLLDARHCGTISASEAELLVHLYGLDLDDPDRKAPTAAQLATEYGISPAALRKRASRAAARIRSGVHSGELALEAQ